MTGEAGADHPVTGSPGAGGPAAGGAGEPPCLVVIDMQRVFGEPGSPWLAPRFAEIVEPVRRLVVASGGWSANGHCS